MSECASRDEVDQAITSLTHAELLRLRDFAALRVGWLGRASSGRTWEDLLGEAKLSTLSGSAKNGNGRCWNKNVAFVIHLIGAMRSISSHWKRDFRTNTLLETEFVQGGGEGESISFLERAISDYPSQEEYVFSRELRDRLLSVENDPNVRLIVDGLLMGVKISETREKSGLTRSEYERVLAKIRRRLRAYRPDMWNARKSRKGGINGGFNR